MQQHRLLLDQQVLLHYYWRLLPLNLHEEPYLLDRRVQHYHHLLLLNLHEELYFLDQMQHPLLLNPEKRVFFQVVVFLI